MPQRCDLGIALLLVTGTAVAQPAQRAAVVIVETRDAPALPALASQLELHTAGSARVESRAERDADPLTFVERAGELVAGGDAELVVWIAPVDGGYLVFAAGPWPDRALIELARIDATMAPAELERTIALKVAGLLDTLRAQAAAAPPAPRPSPAHAPSHVRPWRIEVAAAIARESRERALDGRTALAIGRAWPRRGWELAPSLTGYWQPSGTIEGDGGRAAITELGASVALEGSRAVGPVTALVRPRFTLAVLRARGQSDDGRGGGLTVLSPYVGAELGVRRALAPGVWLGGVAGAELAAIRQKFLIDEETVADLGRVRVHVGLTLTVGL